MTTVSGKVATVTFSLRGIHGVEIEGQEQPAWIDESRPTTIDGQLVTWQEAVKLLTSQPMYVTITYDPEHYQRDAKTEFRSVEA
jgi:hypothetical protein